MKNLALSALAVLSLGGAALADLNDVNDVRLFPREFNDDPNTFLSMTENYPAFVRIAENSYTGGNFANRHVARFSSDGGATARPIGNSEAFYIAFDVRIDSLSAVPRKEAGLLFDTAGGQGHFLVNSDAHEIVAFGGPLPFYAFPATYDLGETIRLEVVYTPNDNSVSNPATIEYRAGGMSSGPLAFSNLEYGIISGSLAGLYSQFPVNTVPGDANDVLFSNIVVIPAPGAAALGLLGLGLIARRRR